MYMAHDYAYTHAPGAHECITTENVHVLHIVQDQCKHAGVQDARESCLRQMRIHTLLLTMVMSYILCRTSVSLAASGTPEHAHL